MRVGKAQACEQKPRQCFASVNHDPVGKVAIQEGNLLMRLLAAAVDIDIDFGGRLKAS